MSLRRAALASLLPLASAAFLASCGSDTNPSTSNGSTGSTSSSSSSGSGGSGGGEPDVSAYLTAPMSCAYHCPNDKCAENTEPYACPALGAWSAMPHLGACGAWDGTYPDPPAGQCVATAPSGAALRRAGDAAGIPGARVLPDGRIVKPAGAEWAFDEADMVGGSTSAIALVPGTTYAITVDTGSEDHAVRAVDTSKIATGSPVTGYVKFSPPSWLNGAVAIASPGRAYVATAYGVVQALILDPAKGSLARDDAASLALPPLPDGSSWYVSGVAVSPDGTRLVATSVTQSSALVLDVDPSSPAYGALLGQVDLGEKEIFGVAFDPNDPAGARAYATAWGGKKVIEIDLTDPAAPKASRSFATDRNPEGLAFLDGRWMAVANDYGETISLVDRSSGAVTRVPVDFEPGLYGLDVSTLAWDPAQQRLYATLAGVNAIAAYDVDLAADPPALTPKGRLPTSWWPSGAVVGPDGSLTVVNLRGHPIGPIDAVSDGDDRMRGSVQQIPPPTSADLAAGEAEVAAQIAVGAQGGYPEVDCPPGVMDFPVPPTNTAGPSPVIQHVFFIVRENKTFDSVLGDLAGVEGDPALTLKASAADMDVIWKNFRDLARGFTTSDNFYNLAVKSTQGHQWTTHGRTTDFCERTWSADARPVPLCGISSAGRPEEGSLFDWLQKNDVVYDILGEIVGVPLTVPDVHNPIDPRYPGGPFQNITYNDLEKACYTAGRLRAACDLGKFVYMTLPNDHTVGASSDNPTPETMCAVNDEATGMFVDALSHSPLWASSLVVITEDDPQTGGDHVDYHRTPLVLVSPWVKRGHVSKTHIDVASLHKLFAHVLGLPYPNLVVKNAGLPLDMFTATPDFTPYTYTPRAWPLACGAGVTSAEARLTSSWDFRYADAQPGLGEQVRRWMRGRQLAELPPRVEAEVAARLERKAKGLPPVIEDDDD